MARTVLEMTNDEVREVECCRCKELLPRDSEFFFRDRNRADGLSTTCKACIAEIRENQVAAAAQDPRLHVLRCALKAGVLLDTRRVGVKRFLHNRCIVAPDARVTGRMLELLSDEGLVRPLQLSPHKRFSPFTLSYSQSPLSELERACAAISAEAEDGGPRRTHPGNLRKRDVQWYLRFRTYRAQCRLEMTTESEAIDNALRSWAERQRAAYQSGQLSVRRRRFLEAIAFDFQDIVYESAASGRAHPVSRTSKVALRPSRWEEMFERFKAFKAANGHCLVPGNYSEDPALGAWVVQQRRLKKVGSARLSEDRIRRLIDVGITWVVKKERKKRWGWNVPASQW